jgi:hypothetical protein
MTARSSETCCDRLGLARAYLLAKRQVIACGFEDEIAWQEAACFNNVTPTVFVREAAWVVLCAGMREAVVRERFDQLGSAFELWNPESIAYNAKRCRHRGLRIFNHAAKLNAIVEIAGEVARKGVEPLLRGVGTEGPSFLTKLPYIGGVTCFHLAKNLGFATAKPDRHLQRIAAALGYDGAQELCEAIADVLAEPVQVVDVVMWRFATIEHAYVSWFTNTIGLPGLAPKPDWVGQAGLSS